ncbi:lipopolysaccharide biosynthesis protein [Aeromonas veronii]|uniref:lipopolysaccharide biosynthesis protein n=1 Tax=Aeromonas veronii TaxID=654 RepID=UPI003D1F08D7
MFKNIIKVLSGNGLAQLIQFSALFILLKTYSPAEFSNLAISQSIATVIAVFFTLQLNHTIPITRGIGARKLIYSCIFVQIIMLSLICSIFVFFIFGLNEVFLGVVLGLLLALYNLNISYLGAQKKFSYLSKVTIFRALAIVTFQYLFSRLNLLYSIIAAVILAELLTQFMFFKIYNKVIINYKRIQRYYYVILGKYKDFYMYGVLAEITAIIAFTFPLYFINYHYGNDVSGNYGMAYRLVWGPIVLLTSSICQVVYTQMGSLEGKKSTSKYIANFKISYIVFYLVLLFFLLFVFKPVFNYIFNNNWKLAAELIPIIGFWGGVYISISIYRLSYRVFHLQRKLLYIDACYLLLLSLFSFYIKCDIYVYLMGSLAIYLFSALITMLYIKAYIREYYAENY